VTDIAQHALPSAETSRAPRIDALTGLRIFPALIVLLSHLKPPAWAGPQLKAFLTSGYAGVTFFFVLSGFVLTHNYFDRFVRGFSLRLVISYFVARLARVYPLYLLLLVWVTFPELWLGKLNDSLWWDHTLALQAWTGTLRDAYAFNAPGWSISVEMFLYACFPVLVFLLLPLLRKPLRAGVALALVVVVMALLTAYFYRSGYATLPWEDPHSSHRWLYRNPLCRLGDFLLGMFAARLVATWTGLPRRALQAGALLSTAAIVALMCWPEHVYSAVSWDFSYALPAALLIFCLASAPASWGTRWLGTKPLMLLGEASYALYLCHVQALGRLKAGKLPPEAWLATNGLTILLVVAFAVGLHVSIERPARELLRTLLDPLAWREAAARRAARRAAASAMTGAEEGTVVSPAPTPGLASPIR
jgi:peptidoglycan/LPS O-acetylase OafA/YrhL